MSQAIATVTGQQERPIGFLGLMRNRNYALLWWGQLVSELGNRFHWFAVSLWVYSLTRSAAAVSLAVSAMFIGGLLVGLWAGAIVDRLDRRKILIVSDVVRAVLVAAIPPLMGIHLWLAYADLALISVASSFFRPAMFAVIPKVVNKRDILPANSFFTAMDTGTEILGPALAGFVAFQYRDVPLLHRYAPLLYFDAFTYVFSALCLMGTSVSAMRESRVERPDKQSMLSDIAEGFQYIKQDPLQRQLFVLIFPAYLVGSGLNALATPLAKGVVGITDVDFGTFNSVWGVGFLVASLLVGWFGDRVSKSALIIGGFFLGFASSAAMGLSRSFNTLLITAFAVGFANTLNYVGLTTVLMERTEQGVIGRVLATRQVALGTVRVLSPLAFGTLGDAIGVRPSIWVMAALGTLGTAAVVAFSPALRRIESVGPPAPIPKVWKFFVMSANPEFDGNQQARLNLGTLAIVGLGWLGVAVRRPLYAVGLLLAVLGSVYLSAYFKGSLWKAVGKLAERMFGHLKNRIRQIRQIPTKRKSKR